MMMAKDTFPRKRHAGRASFSDAIGRGGQVERDEGQFMSKDRRTGEGDRESGGGEGYGANGIVRSVSRGAGCHKWAVREKRTESESEEEILERGRRGRIGGG